MMRSLFSGVSGLQNHQTRMDVIGNNISNVNTTGFKRGRVNFQDLISQTTQGPARPNDRVGGINPKQVGLGMQIATIDTIPHPGLVAADQRAQRPGDPGCGLLCDALRRRGFLHPRRCVRRGTKRVCWSTRPTASACKVGTHRASTGKRC